MSEEPFEDFAIPRRVPTGDVVWKLPIRIPVSDEDLADAGLISSDGTSSITRSVVQTWLDTHQQQSAAELAAERETRKAAAEQAQAAALAEWETLRTKLTDTPQGNTLRELLDVHKSYLNSLGFYHGPLACEYCDQIGAPEREGVDWPCINYETIRDGIG